MFISFVTQRNPVCKSTLKIDGVQYRTLALTATTVYLLKLRYGWMITSLFVPNKNTNVLVAWRHKAPSYQQPWQWPGSPGYFGVSPGRIEHPIRTKSSGARILLICTKIEQQVSRKWKSLVCIDEFQISDSFEFWYVRELLLHYRWRVMHHHAQNKLKIPTHYSVVIMGTMTYQITNLMIGLLNRLFKFRSKKTPKFRVTDLCEGNSPHKWPVTRKMFHLMTSLLNSI